MVRVVGCLGVVLECGTCFVDVFCVGGMRFGKKHSARHPPEAARMPPLQRLPTRAPHTHTHKAPHPRAAPRIPSRSRSPHQWNSRGRTQTCTSRARAAFVCCVLRDVFVVCVFCVALRLIGLNAILPLAGCCCSCGYARAQQQQKTNSSTHANTRHALQTHLLLLGALADGRRPRILVVLARAVGVHFPRQQPDQVGQHLLVCVECVECVRGKGGGE